MLTVTCAPCDCGECARCVQIITGVPCGCVHEGFWLSGKCRHCAQVIVRVSAPSPWRTREGMRVCVAAHFPGHAGPGDVLHEPMPAGYAGAPRAYRPLRDYTETDLPPAGEDFHDR